MTCRAQKRDDPARLTARGWQCVLPNGGRCDRRLASSPHTAGMNVGLGDGSVRFLTGTISPTTWANACNPQDGLTLGNDW